MIFRILVLGVVATGCSGETDATDGGAANSDLSPREVRPICDGSSDLRFAATRTPTGMVGDAKGVLMGAGWSYLYVDGKCHYWVLDELSNHETREGDLTNSQAEQLANDFTYGGWANVRGAWPNNAFVDADWIAVHDTQTGYACYAGCPEAPEFVRDAVGLGEASAFYQWVSRLHEEGEPSSGPIRLTIEQWAFLDTGRDDDLKLGAAEWPLKESPTSIAPWIATSEDRFYPGPTFYDFGGYLVSEESELSALRAARSTGLAASAYPAVTFGPVEEGYAAVQMRDVLPFEDDNAMVPLPNFHDR